MTAVIEEVVAQGGGVGRVARVTGPVVDVEFPAESMPELNNALQVTVDFGGDDTTEGEETITLTLEVAQHIGDNLVRAISMQPTDGLVRYELSYPIANIDRFHQTCLFSYYEISFFGMLLL